MANNHQDEEASPLLAGQSETHTDRVKRFQREYRVHFGAGWITTLLITALITYFSASKNDYPPGICISDRKRSTSILLSIFFGSLGIDRIYLGYVLLGVLKLLTGGLGGIWWTVDLVLLAMDATTDANGCRLH